MVPTLLGVSIIVFSLSRVLPGDVFVAQADSGITPEVRDRMREEAGLNRPLVVQYLEWVGNAARFDFGDSLWNKRSVNSELARSVPITLQLTLFATIIAVIIAVPLGVISAAWQGSPVDYLARFLAVLGLSVPNFVLGTMAIMYFAIWFKWTPPAGGISILSDPVRNLEQFLLPAIILGASMAAATMRMTRSTVLGVLREDYVRTAMAKGLRQRLVLIRHVLRNALLPVLTLMGAQVGYLLGGTVIIEQIFSLSGVGSLAYGAILNRDYFIIQAVTLLAALIFLVLNLLVDLSYAWLDPRVRLT
jgi:peptide/nickel transport system permease protein